VQYLSIVSLILAILLFFYANRQRKIAGLPAGRVIYGDASQWMKVEKPLFNKQLRLTGKPDYLVRNGKQVIPIEVKSGHSPKQPPVWHISQLAAYCVLVESEYGSRPAKGILHYSDRSFSIDFSKSLESSTLAIIAEMQKRTSEIQIDRSHRDPNRCLQCGHRAICEQALRI
jgi:CRISPR-associated exonuclease Cas4